MKTRKLYLLITALMFGTGMLYAQTPGFNLGIKAGINYGTLPGSIKEVKDKSGQAGYTLGVFARAGESLYFQPEVNFSTFGSKYTFSSQNYKPKFRQLNVPLMVGYKLLNTQQLNFRVSLGPELNYTLNKPDAPAGLGYKKFNAGGVLNAGADIGNITLDARYSRGLTKLNKGLEEKSGIFNFSVGLRIF